MSAELLPWIHHFVPGAWPRSSAVLLLLHGSGGDEARLLPLGRALAPEASLLAPRGQVAADDGARYFRRQHGEGLAGADLLARGEELAQFARDAALAYDLPADRFMLAGYSNGANMGASLLLHHPGLFRAAVLFRPILVPAPARLAGLAGLPVFLAGGLLEDDIYREQLERLAELLYQAGAEVTLHWQDAGHALADDEIAAARDWLSTRAL
jgi:phospholipase/carboxylesterase